LASITAFERCEELRNAVTEAFIVPR